MCLVKDKPDRSRREHSTLDVSGDVVSRVSFLLIDSALSYIKVR